MSSLKFVDTSEDIYPLFSLEFINSVGVICNSYFICHLISNRAIYFEKVKRIGMRKRRKLFFNYFFLFMSFFPVVFYFSFKSSFYLNIVLVFLFCIFLCCFFFIRQYEYSIFYLDNNLNYFENIIPNYFKNDLKSFVSKLNKKIKILSKS